ncbi:DUF721 domain-containing protein [Thetidibacter halocola]|uniref:DUF721 domain-containing protein n=1 Tax=Thetidibacter halocola TaxID=2827239 RepID=A0A8J8B9U0_9RHOB|nr:DciA family protein [Thetidibacter halocola]MBS0126199.1 DUF721 domain-containing protein [Thetidibacter halocola]
MTRRNTTTYGFTRTASLLQDRIRKASGSRGFAESRVLTHWEEIVGPDLAAIARPVDVKYGREGLGATLTVLTTGANAPILTMRREELRQRINGAYGYNAIARIRVTQTAATGFADGRVDFVHRKADAPPPEPVITPQARAVADGVADEGLRAALERLAANVISKTERRG